MKNTQKEIGLVFVVGLFMILPLVHAQTTGSTEVVSSSDVRLLLASQKSTFHGNDFLDL